MKQPEKDRAVSSPNGSYKKKYHLKSSLTNRYCASVSNPTVQPDERTEMGVPIPSTENVEYSKEYQEENQRQHKKTAALQRFEIFISGKQDHHFFY